MISKMSCEDSSSYCGRNDGIWKSQFGRQEWYTYLKRGSSGGETIQGAVGELENPKPPSPGPADAGQGWAIWVLWGPAMKHRELAAQALSLTSKETKCDLRRPPRQCLLTGIRGPEKAANWPCKGFPNRGGSGLQDGDLLSAPSQGMKKGRDMREGGHFQLRQVTGMPCVWHWQDRG